MRIKKRSQIPFYFLWLLAFVLVSTIRAAAPDTYLPVVAGTVPEPRTEQIYACQCGAVIASVRQDGTVLLAIQDHSRGGALVVGIDDGTTFRELPNQSAPRSVAPSFDFPGQKQGIGSAVEAWGEIIVYAPTRTEDGGRYNIWRYVYEP